MKQTTALILAGCIGLLSCSSAPPTQRILEDGETALGTGGSTTVQFHSVLYYPAEISLNFPGIILGLEKSKVGAVGGADAIHVQAIEGAGLSKDALRDEIEDKKILYVSHVVESFGHPYGMSNCAHYNAYDRGQSEQDTLASIRYCTDATPKRIPPDQAYASSWDAMAALRSLVKRRLGDHTHVVVVTMGWNTVQEEAVRNFNSIIKNIKAAAGKEPFDPLFIGVTWPSEWKSDWAGPAVRLASFRTKAHDADEVGLTWLGVLLQDTLAGVCKPIVVIGHSFGARAASVATCVGPTIVRAEGVQGKSSQKVDHLINLQGAYRASRLFGGSKQGKLRYPNRCERNAKQIWLTSSINDSAMDSLFWRKDKYVGDDESYDSICKKPPGPGAGIGCIQAKSTGVLPGIESVAMPINYVNADALIAKRAYLSSGGAHSDIYRPEQGVMMWEMISSGQPARRCVPD